MALVKCADCGRSISDAAPACPACGRPNVTRPEATASASGERVLFQDGNVLVTSTRAVFARDTYAMANVTSVRELVEPRPAIVALVGFLLLLVAAIWIAVDVASYGWGVLLVGVAMIVAFFRDKPKRWILVGTAGAETRAMYSLDPQWTRRVVEAMNAAIVSRG